MGMGAIIGFGWIGGWDFSLLWFFLSLLVFGAIIGLLWSLFLAVGKWGSFVEEFKGGLGSYEKTSPLTYRLKQTPQQTNNRTKNQ
jgi:hypothetical protein